MSRTEITVSEAGLAVRQELQCLSLLEVLPEIDADGDGFLTGSEVRDAAERITDYATAHYRVFAENAGAPLLPDAETRHAELLPPPRDAWFPTQEWVAVTWSIERPALARLGVELDLFQATSPGHLDYLRVRWDGHRPVDEVLLADATRFPCGPGESLVREALGRARAAWIPWPAVFLLALALGCARRRDWLLAGGVWLLASSAAVVARVHEFVAFDQRFVELTAALSIAYLAADVVLHPKARGRWVEALLFGALHGIAVGALHAPYALDGDVARPLVAYVGVGVAVGVVALGAGRALGALLRPAEREPRAGLRVCALGLALLGLGLFVQRAFL